MQCYIILANYGQFDLFWKSHFKHAKTVSLHKLGLRGC